jgi:hypothetical protein
MRALVLGGIVAVVAGCEPGGSVSQEKYERHKANRDSYLYQGI